MTFTTIRRNDITTLKKIVNTYERIAISTTLIPLSGILKHYEFTALAIQHINQLFYSLPSHSDIRNTIVDSMCNIAVSSINNKGDDILVIFYFTKIIQNIQQKDDYVIFRTIINGFGEIIKHKIKANISPNLLEKDFEDISDSCNKILNSLTELNAEIALLPIIETEETFPNNCLIITAEALSLRYRKENEIYITLLQAYSWKIIFYLLRLLNNIGQTSIEKGYSRIANLVSKSIAMIKLMCINENPKTYDESLIQNIHYGIESLNSMFIKLGKSQDFMYTSEIPKLLCNIGLFTLTTKKSNIIYCIIDCLFSCCKSIHKIDKFGYATPRIFENILIIGLYSYHLHYYDLINEIIKLIIQYKALTVNSKINQTNKERKNDSLLFSIKELENEILSFDSLSDLMNQPIEFIHQHTS